MKRILFIDKLDIVSVIASLLSRPFFEKVCFRNATSRFRTANALIRLERLGIYWVSYHRLEGSLYMDSFELNFDLGNRAFKNNLEKSFIFSSLIKYFKIEGYGKEKLKTAIKAHCFTNCFADGVSTIPLIRKFFPTPSYKIFFVPSNIAAYIILQELEDSNISVLGIHTLMISLHNLLLKLISILASKMRSHTKSIYWRMIHLGSVKGSLGHIKNKTKVNNFSNYQLAFFPHQGLTYGDKFFKKTYLYEKNSNSIFFKENVLTLFFERDTDKLSKRYFRRFRIPYESVYTLVKMKEMYRELFRFILQFEKPKLLIKKSPFIKLCSNYLLMHFVLGLFRGIIALKHIPSLKVAYFHYDAITPSTFIFACYLKNIKTISAQERPCQYIYFKNFCFDHYLIAGKGFEQLLLLNGYISEKFYPIGLPRAKLLNSTNSESFIQKYNRFYEIKKKFKLVLCYGLMSISDFEVGLYGEDGTSAASCIEFVKILLQVAMEFPHLYLIIRFKIVDETMKILPKSLLDTVKSTPNIEIMEKLSQYNSYKLAGLSDLIIGKQTSIMEESLANGKKIVFYDNERYLSAFDYILDDLDIIATNYAELRKRIDDSLNDNYIDPVQLNDFNEFYFSTNQAPDTGYTLIKKIISDVYISNSQ
jgi:hypothetical protein